MKYESEEESGYSKRVSKGCGVLAPAGKHKQRNLQKQAEGHLGRESKDWREKGKCSCDKDFNPGSPQGYQETCQRERCSK